MQIVASPIESVRATQPPWQAALRTAIRDVVELARLLALPDDWLRHCSSSPSFPVFVPRGFAAKMRPGDLADPLLRQVLPLAQETLSPPGFTNDPVDDSAALVTAGLLQKYQGRVLLLLTGACAIHCRYCFRQFFPYHAGPVPSERRRAILAAIAADPTIEEVIFSGGDPLTLPDSQLAEWVEELAAIPHVQRLRIHSRLPIVIPERVTAELLAWLRGTRLTPWVVVHANHPRELDEEVGQALSRLIDRGIPVLNQTVLLRGVNDDVETLATLSRRLIELRVIPYYLHQLDRVRGTAHFEVPVERGRDLVEALRAKLPGFAVPRYVQELPGDVGKTWL